MKVNLFAVFAMMMSLLLNSEDAFCQKIYFQSRDGAASDYNLNDVRKIFFSKDTMNLLLKDGTTYFWDVSVLRNYRYNETASGTSEWLDAANDWKLNVYPNPANDILNVAYHLSASEQINIALYGPEGKIIHNSSFGKLASGEQLHTLSLQDLPSGVYLMRLNGQKSGITKTFIKN